MRGKAFAIFMWRATNSLITVMKLHTLATTNFIIVNGSVDVLQIFICAFLSQNNNKVIVEQIQKNIACGLVVMWLYGNM